MIAYIDVFRLLMLITLSLIPLLLLLRIRGGGRASRTAGPGASRPVDEASE
jgi:hypothetical protein